MEGTGITCRILPGLLKRRAKVGSKAILRVTPWPRAAWAVLSLNSAHRMGVSALAAVTVFAMTSSVTLGQNMCPTAEKRLEPSSVESGEWAQVNIIVRGHTTLTTATIPFDAVLVIDQSGSMSDNDSQNKRYEAALAFVNRAAQAAAGIRVELVSFSDDAELVQGLTDNYPALRDKINFGGLGGIGGQTNIQAAMERAQNELVSNSQRPARVILLLTDGSPTPNPQAQATTIMQSLVPSATQNTLRYYTVGLGPNADAFLLWYIADKTEGGY